MKVKTDEATKKFVQVSLSQAFAADLRAHADSADRSMASQLEHWAKIARAVESVVPAGALSELKGGKDAGEIMSRLGAYLLQQKPESLRTKLAAATSPRYGVDEDDPDVAVRVDADGTVTRGRFDAASNFVPAAVVAERKNKNESRPKPRKPAQKQQASGRAVARPRKAESRPRPSLAA
ncbi:MAG: hypothetical protein H7346_14215 [Burkholderiaceae bacterium]|nr:hypothetical protein [Burkholderiaceae bacterium]